MEKQLNFITVLTILTVFIAIFLNILMIKYRGYWAIGGELFIPIIPLCLQVRLGQND